MTIQSYILMPLLAGLMIASGDDLKQNYGQYAQPNQYSRPSDTELKQRLTPLQYEVTQQEGTERPIHQRLLE